MISMNADNKKLLNYIGLGCSIVGFGIQLIQNKLADDKLTNTVAEEVAKQIKKLDK